MKEKGPNRFNFCLRNDEKQPVLGLIKIIITENCRLMGTNEDSNWPVGDSQGKQIRVENDVV
jgi:hypothetical protein